MKNQRQAAGQEPPKVPGYIVTYSDMVTLLLTFFVMLMSLASMQDPELFNRGRGSFVQSVRGLGLGILYGKKRTMCLGNKRIKYSADSADAWSAAINMDAREEKLRRMFNQIRQSMETMPSQVVGEGANFSLAEVRFSPGGAILNESAKRFLTEYSVYLRQNPHYEPGTLYVVGLAGGRGTQRQQWLLSARRAQAVAEFLQGLLSSETDLSTRSSHRRFTPNWRIYWWGAGPGGEWIDQDALISRRSQILIAVVRAS